MKPLVSICIPTFNGEKFLRPCLDSAIAQTYHNIEVLIVDDRSSDSSIAIALEYASMDPRIRVVQNEKNLGLVGNWNNCVTLAKGEWIKFLFHDDLLEPECVEKMLKAVTPDIPIVVCKRNFIFDQFPKELKEHFLKIVDQYNMDAMFSEITIISSRKFNDVVLDNLMKNFVGEPTAVMLHRSVFDRFGMFNNNLIQLCDLEYWIRIASNTGLIYVPEALVHFRLHSDGTTAVNNASKRFRMFLDELVCYHDFIVHPLYVQLRLNASQHEPPVNLRQLFASQVKQARKMTVRTSKERSTPDPGLAEELKEISLLFPAFNLVKKIPFSLSYGFYKWKIKKMFDDKEHLSGRNQNIPMMKVKKNPKVFIVILNWNGLKDTLECLDSVYRLSYSNYEVIVVDNGSSDSSVETIRREYPNAFLIENSKNLGFTGGNNVAMKYAMKAGADYVWLLNNDTIIESDTLVKLVDEAEKDPETGLVSPVIHFYDSPEKIQSIGTYADFRNHELVHIKDLQGLDNERVKRNLILWGTALFIKRSVIETVGYLSEEYFAYHEDCDYSLRAHRAHFRTAVRLDARVFHKDSQTTGKRSPMQIFLRTRNAYFLWMGNEKGFRRFSVPGHYISMIISYAKCLSDEGNETGLDACLSGVWAAFRGKGGAYDPKFVIPSWFKAVFSFFISWHPYFWASLFKGNVRGIVRETLARA